MDRIDSHHHFWNYSREEYGWISESMQVLRQDYLPADLRREIQSTHIDGVVSVQAQQSVVETERLVKHANTHDWIRGVVGWLPLADPSIVSLLDRFQNEPRLKGVRHVVQDETDDGFLARSDFNRGVASLPRYGLVYDILVYARQLPFVIPFVDQHPNVTFVLDHIAKPQIQSSAFDTAWKTHIIELAKRKNVFCKFSGVVTEVRDTRWDLKVIQPYWDVALQAFTPARLMFGSDWPVCLLRSTYADWVAAVGKLTESLSDTERAQFWSGTATQAYRLVAR